MLPMSSVVGKIQCLWETRGHSVKPSELWNITKGNTDTNTAIVQKMYPPSQFNNKKCFLRKWKYFFYVLAVHVHTRISSWMLCS